MTIVLKNKHTLKIKDFFFKCVIGKNGLSKSKKEGDKKTPKGTFGIQHLYFRKDKIEKPECKLRCIEIKKNMGWCDDVRYHATYNKLIKIKSKIKHEKLKRNDDKYDLIIPIKYNFKKPIVGLGSCIFIHLTKNYKPTAGCIALAKKDFLIMLKLIDENTKIKII
ncbi:L,D-transpeptidase family protein [Candidatus Pelagibacter sp. HIMB1709]|uniref:L,D-transpeptidase family protein n=1 Tax=Candidatus Pelagibacter sp. HIMB1709 TaxID=3413367 RepID=UPI003F851B1B